MVLKRFIGIALIAGYVHRLGGCVYDWNGSQPAFTLQGDPPPLSSFEKLNAVPAGQATQLSGPDGAPWAVFCEFWANGGGDAPTRICKKMHLHRLADTPANIADETSDADGFSLHVGELYELRDDMTSMMRTITLHRPGDGAGNVSFTVPDGRYLLYVNDLGDPGVFVYWVLDPSTTRFDVFRRDQRFHLRVPVPSGVDPAKPTASALFDFLLTRDGNTLVLSDAGGELFAFSTVRDAPAVDLGAAGGSWLIDDARSAVLLFGAGGLLSQPLDGGPPKVITNRAFDFSTLAIWGDQGFFADASGLWRVPLDGSAPAQLVAPGAARLLTLGPRGEVVYSTDPAIEYAGAAGDGWLDGAKFMQRGRRLAWSGDGARLRFLENAATIGTYGDLTSYQVAGAAESTLGINVHAFTELPDGRVLAIENHVYAGDWNRLVVIDETAGTKKWVVPSTAEFFLASDGKSIIADVITGASGYDILRAPIPPR